MAVPVLIHNTPQILDLEISIDFSSSHFIPNKEASQRRHWVDPRIQSGCNDKNKILLLCHQSHFTNSAVTNQNGCWVTSMCMDGCVLLPLVLPAVVSSESFAEDPVISAAGDVLYWTPSRTVDRGTLLLPNIHTSHQVGQTSSDIILSHSALCPAMFCDV